MHQARSDLSLAVVDGKIYAIGGNVLIYQDANGIKSKEVGTNEQYDPNQDTWTDKASMPTPGSDFAAVVYAGKIYCIGGGVTDVFNNTKGTWETKQTSGFNQVYDPATDSWENKTAAPTPETHAKAFLINDKIYLVNGYPDINLMQVYDPATDNWVEYYTLPLTQRGAAAVLGSSIYFFETSEIKIFDTATGTWRMGAQPAISCYTVYAAATTGIVTPKSIVVLGNPTWAPNASLFVTQIYNPQNDSWQDGASMPTQRMASGVAVVDDAVYVVGGYIPSFPPVASFPQIYSIKYTGATEVYYPPEYGFAPPLPCITTPENASYSQSSIPLTFNLSRPVNWTSYSLDGHDNVTFTGNVTLGNLPNGAHNITVYAGDDNGIGASQTVNFTVAVNFSVAAPPLPSLLIIIAAPIAIAAIILAMIIYRFKKS
jgi:Uncharacterized protein conserved in bacteria